MKYLLTISALLFFSNCFAQQQYVYLYNNNDQRVLNKDSMAYIRVIKGPGNDSLYNVTEYYRSGKIKTTGQLSVIYPPLWEGPSISYWPNGNKQKSSTNRGYYRNNTDSSFFYNGKLHTVFAFTLSDSKSHLDTLIKICNDSTGKALVVDGNGYFMDYDDNSGVITSEGEVKNGIKEGMWKGKIDGFQYTERYGKGKLISGDSEKDGKHYHYNASTIEQPATFAGGMEAFYYYLKVITEYPASDRTKKIQGKVTAKFAIDKDGSVTDIEIIRSPSNDMANETRRVLTLSPSWIPGTERGIPVKRTLSIPINFGL